MLQAFYTDAVGDLGVLGLVGRLIPRAVRPKAVHRLFGRHLPGDVPRGSVISAPGRSLAHAALSRLRGATQLAEKTSPGNWLKKTIVEEDFRGANALYSLDNSDLGIIREASRRRMFVAYEQIICADVGRTMREERERYPGIEAQDPEDFVEAGIRADLDVWKLADVVLAASEHTRSSMIGLGCAPERIALVPYGVDQRWFDIPSRPVPGRVLFVGTVGLRKGNHYLAEAYRILRDRGVATEFRVVGPHDAGVIASPIFQGPTYVGQVPRAQIGEEFAQADLFVFPTLAEGFGLVHLEAMACGVPVVTTRNCGSVVRDGVDGHIVPIRNAQALADAVEGLIVDRKLRERMGQNARDRAAKYTWADYSKTLVRSILRAGSGGSRSNSLAAPVRPALALNR